MSAPWRRLWAKLVECDDLAALLPRDPAPEMLFVRIIATADAYGRVPGDPYMLRARTFPKSHYTATQIMACAEALGEMLTWYEVDGRRYIQVTNAERYNPPDWSKTGRPEFPHPPDWQPPESLLQFLRAHIHLAPFTYARYGLTEPTLSVTQCSQSELILRVDTQSVYSEATLSNTQPPRESRWEKNVVPPLPPQDEQRVKRRGGNVNNDANGTDRQYSAPLMDWASLSLRRLDEMATLRKWPAILLLDLRRDLLEAATSEDTQARFRVLSPAEAIELLVDALDAERVNVKARPGAIMSRLIERIAEERAREPVPKPEPEPVAQSPPGRPIRRLTIDAARRQAHASINGTDERAEGNEAGAGAV